MPEQLIVSRVRQKEVLKPEVQITLSPAHYAAYVSGGRWVAAEHLKILTKKLVEVEQGKCKRLIVAMPPRHGKSELISKYYPAWYLSLHPNKRVMLAGYEATFAADWGRKAREEFTTNAHLFGTALNESVTANANWETTSGGGMASVGAGGALTGRGADLLIIDDPIKNADEARSAHARNQLWDWYSTTAYSRLEPGGAVIILHTRWNEDDLIGRLLAHDAESAPEERENWEVLELPALCEDPEADALGRKLGEALWPERYDEKRLAIIRRQQGSYFWAALYQQHPSPLEGQLFKRDDFRYFAIEGTEEDPVYKLATVGDDEKIELVSASTCKRFQTVDLAASIKTTADYFVIMTWAQTPKNQLLLLDTVRTRVEGPDQLPLLQAKFNEWKPAYIGIESVSFQITAIQNAIRAGLPVRKLTPDKDKISRAITAGVRYEAHTIYHLANASWLHDLESELVNFPNSKHDDQVDCIAYAASQSVANNIVFASVSTVRTR